MALAKGKGKVKGKGKGTICYQCGKTGHIAANCWQKGKGKGKAKGKSNSGVICKSCGQAVHISPNCPMNKGTGKGQWKSVNEVDWWSND